MKPKTTFGNTLRFTPYAYAKLLWMRDRGDTEVAGYCVTGTEDPLLVTDFVLIKQECTSVTFDLDPEDGVEHTERMMDQGLSPWACNNILAHTHPGNCPNPSSVDEKNFVSAFSHPDWAIMFIIANGGETYCRLKINIGPGVTKQLGVEIDWGTPFAGTNIKSWEAEYIEKVSEKPFRMTGKEGTTAQSAHSFPDIDDPLWWDKEHERWSGLSALEDSEFNRNCQSEVKELGELDCFWDNEGLALYWDDDSDEWYGYDPIDKIWYTGEAGSDTFEYIETPDEPWVAQVLAWAEKNASERVLAMEN